MTDTHPQEARTPVGGPADPTTVTEDMKTALNNLLTLWDVYDPGPVQPVRDAVDYARAVMAKANARSAPPPRK